MLKISKTGLKLINRDAVQNMQSRPKGKCRQASQKQLKLLEQQQQINE